MKGGVAAMILASILAFEESPPEGGIRLIFSAAEELGCIGIQQLAKTLKDPGSASCGNSWRTHFQSSIYWA